MVTFDDMNQLVWDYHRAVKRRRDDVLEEVVYAIDLWIDGAFRGRFPPDWRAQYRAVLADQAAQGRRIVPHTADALERWLHQWAGQWGLLPEQPVMEHYHRWWLTQPGGRALQLAAAPQVRVAQQQFEVDTQAFDPRFDLPAVPSPPKRTRPVGRFAGRRKIRRPGKESFFNRNLAIAGKHLDEIERLLQALGAKLDAAKLDEQVDVETEVDAIETLIWSYNDALESARAAWLRDDLSGDATTRLNQMFTPLTFGLPLFTDQLQADRAQKQQLEISRRLSGRDVTISRVIVGMQVVETATTVAGIAAGGGVVVVAAMKGGKWAVVKTVAAIAAGMAADEVAERVAGAAGLNEQTIRGVQLAAAVVKLILLRRGSRSSSAEQPSRAAPDRPAAPDANVPSKPAPRQTDVATNRTGRLRDPKTGRFVSDPANPPSPHTMTDAQRRAHWKRLAQDPTSPLTPAQRAEIKARGSRGPRRKNKFGEWETMELSHEPTPLREGGTSVMPRWPGDHAALDPHRLLPKHRE